jgi:hypothetical protein
MSTLVGCCSGGGGGKKINCEFSERETYSGEHDLLGCYGVTNYANYICQIKRRETSLNSCKTAEKVHLN